MAIAPPGKITENRCEICNSETEVGFNINFKLVYICEDCASSIFLQQAQWYVKEQYAKAKLEEGE